jgi:O-antigen/teichoic acid export membrane protein
MSKIVKTVSVGKSNKASQKKNERSGKVEFSDFWGVKNIIMLVIGFVALLIGFYLMSVSPWDSNAALNISPLFLLAAYLIFFPLSIFIKNKK